MALCLPEEGAEGFLNLADGVKLDVILLAIEALKVVFGDNHIRKA